MTRAKAAIWRHSTTVKLTADWLIWLLAFPAALWLRHGNLPETWVRDTFILAIIAAPTIRFCITAFGLHRQSWGHASLADAQRLGAAIFLGTFMTTALVILLNGLLPIFLPRSIPLIAGTIALAGMGSMRLTLRGYVEQRHRGLERIVVAGTNDSAILFARNLQRGTGYLVGFIDDDPTRQGVSYLGRPVLGQSRDAIAIVRQHKPATIVVAWKPNTKQSRMLEAACESQGVRCRYLADPTELLYGRMQRADATGEGLKDLLRRDVTKLDQAAIRATLEAKRVLVTGAGGSIGSELARQIAGHGPTELLLLSHDENSIFELEPELRRGHPGTKITLLVANIQDRQRLDHLFEKHKPDVVFHAAAHKHVPLMEAHPSEAVRNNVGGTRNLVELALEHGVARFVNISTDKAVNPTNVMGSTKHVAEMLVRDAAHKAPERDFVSVRFGNVLGSRGSVIPTWERQIAAGGPVTLTHEDMTRYFMLIPEAVQLVLQAGVFGGAGTTYVLDMGEPVKIKDMASQLIRLHGFVPGQDIQIKTTGLRPGEKLYEELLLDPNRISQSPHEKILVEGDLPLPERFAHRIDALLDAARRGDDSAVRQGLEEIVPGARLMAG